ncbi:MAG: hydantoinase/oxoprolinase family protein, partial [Verrucomicrobiota bacterium]
MDYKIRVDTGGTFTDCWGQSSDGETTSIKVLSSGKLRVEVAEQISPREIRLEIPENWSTPSNFFTGFLLENHLGTHSQVVAYNAEDWIVETQYEVEADQWVDLSTGEEAPILGTRLLTGTGLDDPFPPLDFRLATTRGTNALLERKGAPVAFFVTEGFADLLEIGDQRRSDLFALNHQKPTPMYQSVVEIEERLDAKGNVILPLEITEDAGPALIEGLINQGITTAAVALLHSYENPEHEEKLRDFLLGIGFEHVSISSELAPLIKILPRAETAVANAYLQPIMQTFLDHIRDVIGHDTETLTMTSSGGLEPVEVFRPKDSLLSGPAGGVAGAAAIARELGFTKVLTFDMGGTSTDVARYDGDFIYRFEQKVGDARLLSTGLKIETVAAGGGSICQWTGGGLRVGPESAGADPGPACYGRGGPLTVTDVNLLLGRIDASNFGIPLNDDQIERARKKALELQERAFLSPDQLDTNFLEGLLDIAVEQMADAIRTISVRDGADPKEYALLAFGGAGPLHACAIAEKLGISTVIVPAEAGVLSAYGLEQAAVERIAERQIDLPLSEATTLEKLLEEVHGESENLLKASGQEIHSVRYIAQVRLAGQDSALTIEFSFVSQLEAEFHREYSKVFGYAPPKDRSIEVVSFRAVASSGKRDLRDFPPLDTYIERIDAATSLRKGGFIDRRDMYPGDRIYGPVTVQDPFSTLRLEPYWEATVEKNGSLLVKKFDINDPLISPDKPHSDEVIRELFRHRFEHVVEEMGTMLQRSAISTNVKERLDYSCALLDAKGQLVASAHHIPVH